MHLASIGRYVQISGFQLFLGDNRIWKWKLPKWAEKLVLLILIPLNSLQVETLKSSISNFMHCICHNRNGKAPFLEIFSMTLFTFSVQSIFLCLKRRIPSEIYFYFVRNEQTNRIHFPQTIDKCMKNVNFLVGWCSADAVYTEKIRIICLSRKKNWKCQRSRIVHNIHLIKWVSLCSVRNYMSYHARKIPWWEHHFTISHKHINRGMFFF